MRSHLRETHKEQFLSTFKCLFRCPEFFLTEAERNKHIESFHNNRLAVRCIYCNKLCMRTKLLHKHINDCHISIKIWCRFRGCCQYFHTQADLEAHYKQVHWKKENPIMQCSQCDYMSDNIYKLKSHTSVNHGTKNKWCPKCEKCFRSSISLKTHLHLAHAQPKVCKHCNMKFAYLGAHQIQNKCTKCQQVLMCRQAAKLHRKNC
jgi:hypothetical protein